MKSCGALTMEKGMIVNHSQRVGMLFSARSNIVRVASWLFIQGSFALFFLGAYFRKPACGKGILPAS